MRTKRLLNPTCRVSANRSFRSFCGKRDIQESIIVVEPVSQGQLRKSFNLLRDLPSQKGQDLSVTITSKDQKFAFSFKTSISKMKGVFLRMLQNVVEMYRVLAENGTGTSIKHVIFIRLL